MSSSVPVSKRTWSTAGAGCTSVPGPRSGDGSPQESGSRRQPTIDLSGTQGDQIVQRLTNLLL